MKKIILLICMMFTLSFTSCVVGEYATTQDDLYTEAYSDVVRSNVDINIVLTRGVPYYYEGSILYYMYNGLYYYPFYYDNYWYMRVYRRPFDHLYYRPYFRPNRYDYRFNRDFHQPRGWRVDPIRPRNNRFGNRPNGNRPDVRPNQPQPDRRTQPQTRSANPTQQQVVPRQTTPQQVTPRQTTPQQVTPQQQRPTFGGSRTTTTPASPPTRTTVSPPTRTTVSPSRSAGTFGGARTGGRR